MGIVYPVTDGKIPGWNVIEEWFNPDPVGAVVTRVGYGFTITNVGPNGTDMASKYGMLHVDPDGSASYTRTAANLWDASAPPSDAREKFVFEIRESNGAISISEIEIGLLPSDSALRDSNAGTATGNDFDEFIGLTDVYRKGYGNGGQDKIVGTDKANYISGGAGNDWLIGNGGDDRLDGGAGEDRLEGGSGFDMVSYDSATSGVTVDLSPLFGNTGHAKGDDYIGIEAIAGTKYADKLLGDDTTNIFLGGGSADVLMGWGGDDIIEGGAGGDTLAGGAGTIDKASYAASGAGVTVNLATNANSGGDAAGDKLSGVEYLVGSEFNDQLTGDDTLDGGGGDDAVFGGNGNDLMKGSAGTDFFMGGEGKNPFEFDKVSYAGDPIGNITVNLPDTSLSTGWAKNDSYLNAWIIVAGAGDDILTGDFGSNRFEGGDGNDKLAGGNGSDTLFGGANNDIIDGGDGDDWICADAGADKIDGGLGNDLLTFTISTAGVVLNRLSPDKNTGDAKGDTYSGIEYFWLSDFNDQFVGTKQAETVTGQHGNDTLSGGGGNDSLNGEWGNDTLNGNEGDDELVSTLGGTDTLNGGSGNDHLTVQYGTSTMNGDAGDDVMQGGLDTDKMYGGADNDTLDGGLGNDILDGGTGNDTLDGGDGIDTLYGGTGNDGLVGGIGNDTLNGGDGNDTLSGDPGDDTLNGDAGNDSLWGWTGIDKLNGGTGHDTLYGGTGNDTLKGEADNDTLWGEQGDDTLTGGTGIDTFAWKAVEGGKDKVTDFKLGEDKLKFDDVLDGAGSDVQDLIDAGFTASTSGSTLTVAWNGGAASVQISGWTGGAVNNVADLGQVLGGNLVVEH